LLLVPFALTFPGAFAPDGLLDAGINSTASIAWIRRVAFPLAIILYVLLMRTDAATQGMDRPAPRIVLAIGAAIVLAAAITLLTTIGHDLLPAWYINRTDPVPYRILIFESAAFSLFATATVILFRNRRSVLDLWLLVALADCLIQSALVVTLDARFTAGWYCLYVLILISHLIVMLALITESNRLYARLALSTAARNRERQIRLMSLDSVAAAIAHEVGQPIAAATTHGMASMHWMTQAPPVPDKAVKALRENLDAVRRTSDVIKSIRAMFDKGTAAATEINLNDLVRETAALLDRELAAERISLRIKLDEDLPPILADRVQIQRVIVNLFTNAIESLGETPGRPRTLGIRSAPLDGGDVLLEVSDSGTGIAPEEAERIFEPFFTTKAHGTGLGLSLCRTIVEEHGGRLWATPGEPHGSTFHLKLPCISLPAQ
jgi:signal transduction histidine kinase